MPANTNRAFSPHQNRALAERRLLSRFFKLAAKEPRLLPLLTDIMAAQPTTSQWYRDGWKDRMVALVGWGTAISSEDDQHEYDTVYGLLMSYCYDGPSQ
jgi:hypothetical protein